MYLDRERRNRVVALVLAAVLLAGAVLALLATMAGGSPPSHDPAMGAAGASRPGGPPAVGSPRGTAMDFVRRHGL